MSPLLHGRRALLAAALAVAAARPARAADDVAIGVILPLTGNSAQVGLDDKAALEMTAELINGSHDPLPMLMGRGGGLDRLGGARLRLVFADHQGDPQKARAEAERLITQDRVAALLGTYQSATAATGRVSSAVPQRRPPAAVTTARAVRSTRASEPAYRHGVAHPGATTSRRCNQRVRSPTTVRAMIFNPMQLPGMTETSSCGGYYHHEMVRTSDGWRSRRLREENVWFVNGPGR